MSALYAYVMFLGDKEKETVPVHHIKGYEKLRLKIGEIVKVFWSEDDELTPAKLLEEQECILDVEDLSPRAKKGKHGPLAGYYTAEILLLGESEEDIENKLAKKRLKLPSVKVVEKRPDISEPLPKKTTAANKKRLLEQAQRQSDAENFKSLKKPDKSSIRSKGNGKNKVDCNSSSDEEVVPARKLNKRIAFLQEENDGLKKKVAKLREEKMLAEKRAAEQEKEKLNAEKKVDVLQSLNMQLQVKLLDPVTRLPGTPNKRFSPRLSPRFSNKVKEKSKEEVFKKLMFEDDTDINHCESVSDCPKSNYSDDVPVKPNESVDVTDSPNSVDMTYSTANSALAADVSLSVNSAPAANVSLSANADSYKITDPFSRDLMNRVKAGSKGDSQYAKNLAKHIFTDAVLAVSSVSGQKYRGKKDAVAKPPLDPVKINYLREIFILRLKEQFKATDKESKLQFAIENRANRKIIEDYLREKIQTLNRVTK